MQNNDVLRVPCNRCGQAFEVKHEHYNQEGGVVYCQECLAPFVCSVCGERRYTIPEKIPADGNLVCKYCDDGSEKDRDEKSLLGKYLEFHFWGIVGVLCLIPIVWFLFSGSSIGYLIEAFIQNPQNMLVGIGMILYISYKLAGFVKG